MQLITLEEHIKDRKIFEEIKKYSKEIKIQPEDSKEVLEFYRHRDELDEWVMDVEEKRLPYMDAHNIRMQVLSYINPAGDAPEEDVLSIYRRANDFLAEKVKEHPDRFAAFATLPVDYPEEAAKELERCVRDYHFCGTLLTGKTKGHFLDEKAYFPIFEKAAELDVPVYFHPSIVEKNIRDYYYTSQEGAWSPLTAREFGSAGLGWHLDIGIQMIRMIISGIFAKLPNLKIIAGHWGEGMPACLDRIDSFVTKELTGLDKNISEYYKENVYVVPSGIISEMNLEAVTKYMGAEHVLWAVDYPYVQPDNIYDFLANSSLTQEEKELIAHKNAERLLKL